MSRPTPLLDEKIALAARSSSPVYRMAYRRQSLNYAQPFMMFHATSSGLMTSGEIQMSRAMDPTYRVQYRPVKPQDVYALIDERAAIVTNAHTARRLVAYARQVGEDSAAPDGAHRIAFGLEKAHAMCSIPFGLMIDLSMMARTFYFIAPNVVDALAFIMAKTGYSHDANGHLALVRHTCLSTDTPQSSPLLTRQNKVMDDAKKMLDRAGVMSLASLGFSGEVSNSRHFIVGDSLSSAHAFVEATDPIYRYLAAENGDLTRLSPVPGEGSRIKIEGTFRLGFNKNALLFTDNDNLGLGRLTSPSVDDEVITASLTSGGGRYASDNSAVATMVASRGGWIIAEPFTGRSLPSPATLRCWGNDPKSSGKPAPVIPKRTMPMHIAIAGAPSS